MKFCLDPRTSSKVLTSTNGIHRQTCERMDRLADENCLLLVLSFKAHKNYQMERLFSFLRL